MLELTQFAEFQAVRKYKQKQPDATSEQIKEFINHWYKDKKLPDIADTVESEKFKKLLKG